MSAGIYSCATLEQLYESFYMFIVESAYMMSVDEIELGLGTVWIQGIGWK